MCVTGASILLPHIAALTDRLVPAVLDNCVLLDQQELFFFYVCAFGVHDQYPQSFRTLIKSLLIKEGLVFMLREFLAFSNN